MNDTWTLKNDLLGLSAWNAFALLNLGGPYGQKFENVLVRDRTQSSMSGKGNIWLTHEGV